MVVVEEKYKNVKSLDGRDLGTIIEDYNENFTHDNDDIVDELVNLVGYLIDRLQHSEHERFIN